MFGLAVWIEAQNPKFIEIHLMLTKIHFFKLELYKG